MRCDEMRCDEMRYLHLRPQLLPVQSAVRNVKLKEQAVAFGRALVVHLTLEMPVESVTNAVRVAEGSAEEKTEQRGIVVQFKLENLHQL